MQVFLNLWARVIILVGVMFEPAFPSTLMSPPPSITTVAIDSLVTALPYLDAIAKTIGDHMELDLRGRLRSKVTPYAPSTSYSSTYAYP